MCVLVVSKYIAYRFLQAKEKCEETVLLKVNNRFGGKDHESSWFKTIFTY